MAKVIAFANNKDHAPVERSLSEQRAHSAALWVEKEIDKLITEIEKIGKKNGGEYHITFGELFQHYQDVSDTLVGILQRAKRRNILTYNGDMLLQRIHDHVVIILDHAKGSAWQKEYQANGGNKTAPPPSAPPVRAHVTIPHQAKPALRSTASVTAKPAAAMKPLGTPLAKSAAGAITAVKKADVPTPVVYCLAITIVLVFLTIIYFLLRRLLFGR